MPYISPYINPPKHQPTGFRTFGIVSTYKNHDIKIPQRHTKGSAGYDLEAAATVVIPPLTTVLVPTGLRVFMTENEYLMVAIRSSLAAKQNLSLANGVGIIDSDYCNADNEGHIMVALRNNNPINEEGHGRSVTINKHDRIAQGIFMKYLITDDDAVTGKKRIGGFGSTGK